MPEYVDREAVKKIMQKYRCLDCTNEKSLDCPLCQLHRPFDEISKIPSFPENMRFMMNEQERSRDNAKNL